MKKHQGRIEIKHGRKIVRKGFEDSNDPRQLAIMRLRELYPLEAFTVYRFLLSEGKTPLTYSGRWTLEMKRQQDFVEGQDKNSSLYNRRHQIKVRTGYAYYRILKSAGAQVKTLGHEHIHAYYEERYRAGDLEPLPSVEEEAHCDAVGLWLADEPAKRKNISYTGIDFRQSMVDIYKEADRRIEYINTLIDELREKHND